MLYNELKTLINIDQIGIIKFPTSWTLKLNSKYIQSYLNYIHMFHMKHIIKKYLLKTINFF